MKCNIKVFNLDENKRVKIIDQSYNSQSHLQVNLFTSDCSGGSCPSPSPKPSDSIETSLTKSMAGIFVRGDEPDMGNITVSKNSIPPKIIFSSLHTDNTGNPYYDNNKLITP